MKPSANRATADAMLDLVCETIAARLVTKLLALGLGSGAGTDQYTSNELPPDVRTKARFNRLARSIPGARRDGRVWIVPRPEWQAFRTARTADAVAVPDGVDCEADEMLSGAGLRSSLRLVGRSK